MSVRKEIDAKKAKTTEDEGLKEKSKHALQKVGGMSKDGNFRKIFLKTGFHTTPTRVQGRQHNDAMWKI